MAVADQQQQRSPNCTSNNTVAASQHHNNQRNISVHGQQLQHHHHHHHHRPPSNGAVVRSSSNPPPHSHTTIIADNPPAHLRHMSSTAVQQQPPQHIFNNHQQQQLYHHHQQQQHQQQTHILAPVHPNHGSPLITESYLPDLVRGVRSRGSVASGSGGRDGSDTSSAYSGSDTMCHSVHSLDHEDVDLSGLMESVVDSDEEDLAESMEVRTVRPGLVRITLCLPFVRYVFNYCHNCNFLPPVTHVLILHIIWVNNS